MAIIWPPCRKGKGNNQLALAPIHVYSKTRRVEKGH
jgi:hypothetical protein